MKTTLMTCRVDALALQGADVLGMPAVLVPAAAVRERRIAPDAPSTHGTGLPVAGNGTAVFSAFGTALPGPPRGAPV